MMKLTVGFLQKLINCLKNGDADNTMELNAAKSVEEIIGMNKEAIKAVLDDFLRFDLTNSTGVLDKYASLPGAISCRDGEKRNYVFVPGSREDRIVIAAHADTVWDTFYKGDGYFDQTVVFENGIYSGTNADCGIGADDRAGCAIVWLLRNLGHSLLILDGEEHGQIGANHIRNSNPELYRIINEHNYIIQFDRRGSSDYKTYSLPVSQAFVQYVESTTGYHDAGKNARTDIVALCSDICGVNLSIGYYNEHKSEEVLVFDDWYHTLELAARILVDKQPKFLLDKV